MFHLNTLSNRVRFCIDFSVCKCRKHEKCDKNGKCKCKKGYIKIQGKCVRVKGLCLTYYSWTSTNGHLSILQGPHFWGTVHNWHLFPPLYNGHLFTAATLLSSIPKVAVKESFNCNCNITSENTVHLLYTLFRFLKGLHFSSFLYPSHRNHQWSFHLSPSLVNIHFFASAFQDQEWRLLHQAFRSRDTSDKCPARRSGLNCMNLAFATTFTFHVLWTPLKFFSLVSWPFFFYFPDLYNTHVHSLIKWFSLNLLLFPKR